MKSLFRLIASVRRTRRGVTLVQVVLVIALMAAFGSLGFPSYQRARATADRNRCDMQLKGIALAIDAYRQAHHALPPNLEVLRGEDYIHDESQLHCPCDPRDHPSYQDFYVLRARNEKSDVPLLMCPFHEKVGFGNQARIGLYTTQFATRPARLEGGNSVSVESPGQDARAGYAGMELHGGDIIRTNGGSATISFVDGSTANLHSGSTVTVLQSFIDGHQGAALYTVLRQTIGTVTYTVHHGSHFDVTTPTATAGARGTQFDIIVTEDRKGLLFKQTGGTTLIVKEGRVAFTGGKTTAIVPAGHTCTVFDLLNGLLGGLLG